MIFRASFLYLITAKWVQLIFFFFTMLLFYMNKLLCNFLPLFSFLAMTRLLGSWTELLIIHFFVCVCSILYSTEQILVTPNIFAEVINYLQNHKENRFLNWAESSNKRTANCWSWHSSTQNKNQLLFRLDIENRAHHAMSFDKFKLYSLTQLQHCRRARQHFKRKCEHFCCQKERDTACNFNLSAPPSSFGLLHLRRRV